VRTSYVGFIEICLGLLGVLAVLGIVLAVLRQTNVLALSDASPGFTKGRVVFIVLAACIFEPAMFWLFYSASSGDMSKFSWAYFGLSSFAFLFLAYLSVILRRII